MVITLQFLKYQVHDQVLDHSYNVSLSETSLSIVKIEIWDLITLNTRFATNRSLTSVLMCKTCRQHNKHFDLEVWNGTQSTKGSISIENIQINWIYQWRPSLDLFARRKSAKNTSSRRILISVSLNTLIVVLLLYLRK